MSNATLMAIPWLALAAHVAVGVVVGRRWSSLPLLPLINLATAACVLLYWAQRWYGYLFRGVTWYGTDQLMPLYAILVCVLAGLTLTGRLTATAPHWVVFGVDAVALLGAALLFSFVRITRLI
ncbi:MAG: hypothetical protein JWL95_2109 [Gemmatimonadetes bacterium]|nr:hypothetical protein [Gemmatimonadota bacterium]